MDLGGTMNSGLGVGYWKGMGVVSQFYEKGADGFNPELAVTEGINPEYNLSQK